MQLPRIDLAAWSAGGEPAAVVARQVDAACRDIGFLHVVGHGIPGHVIDGALRASEEFFALPLEEKRLALPSHPGVNRGYAALGTEALAYSLGVDEARPDLFEAFNIGPDDGPPAGLDDPHGFFAPNVWPARPAGLRPALLAHFAEAHRVALVLTEVFAAALGLPLRWFAPHVDRSTLTMRVNHYERRRGDPLPEPGQVRMGAHTDYGMVTVLCADPVPGLQIVGSDGAWHDVVPEPGALLVNLGDLTAQWTNDRWRSTLHRVVPPPPDASGRALRRSIAFFFDANADAVVECLPTCRSAGAPPRYEPVVAGAHLLAKVLGPRTLQRSSAVDTAGDRLASLHEPVAAP